MRILFIHEGLGQFQTLHEHLNNEGLAHSWFLCTAGVYNANKDKIPNLVPFAVAGENPNSYFYTKNLEARIQRSFLIKQAIGELLKKTGIDLIVAHGSGGFPLQLFDEFDIPIITYIEFPSFGHHGHDPKYPQPDYATFRDKVFEMFVTGRPEGTGLGLFLARTAVRRCGGDIQAHERSGGGADLRIILPAVQALAAPLPETAPARKETP